MLRVKLTTALLIATATWPAGAYAITGPDSPGVPTAVPDAGASAPQDLRSPDARDAALAAEASQSQDLRSPDTRDAAREPVPEYTEGAVSPSRSSPSASDAFQWSDAGIGAAVMLALVSAASATLVLAGRSRQRRTTT